MRKRKTYFITYSFNKSNLASAKLVAEKLSGFIGWDILSASLISLKFTQQQNEYDCGVYTCWNIESLVRDIVTHGTINIKFIENAKLN